jgi:uncharacterized cupin superfamily protein
VEPRVTDHQPWHGFDRASLRPQCAHDGDGDVLAERVVDRATGALAWVDLVVVPPGVTIGRHTHGLDEELYVVLAGEATMVVDGEERVVRTGDVVHNRAFGTHELCNRGSSDVRLVVVDVRAG